MNVLALDTTLDFCSLAVVQGDDVLFCARDPLPRGHAERIAPLAREGLAAAGLKPTAIDRVVTTIGPGSFTGVRVGIAFARAFALAINAPSLGVSTLAALALEAGPEETVAPMIATGEGVFMEVRRGGAELFAPAMLTLAEARERAAAFGARPIGPAAFRVAATPADPAPDPARLARWAATAPPDQHPARPLYIRAPDAKPAGQP